MSCDGEALGVGSKVPMGRRWWMGGLEGARLRLQFENRHAQLGGFEL
jgi:hypothetical protein